MKRFDIGSYGIRFKNLISGPAPVGRILNYIYYAGNGNLKHKNGYRSTDLQDNIGYAWTTELMIGLDLVSIGSEINDTYILELTEKGKRIFDLLPENSFVKFDEGSTEKSIESVKAQMKKINHELYKEYKKIFINSFPFLILREYLLDNGYYYRDRKIFIDDYFETIKDEYDTDPTPYNRMARTTTGDNRMPSLLQLCILFDLLKQENNTLIFNSDVVSNLSIQIHEREFNENELLDVSKKEEKVISDIKNLAERYGIDGTTMVNSVVRNSTLQSMFRNNLMITQGHKCIMCGMSNKELLIGSHIKPAAESNVHEKVNTNNGLLLCCNHDKLFDRHLITFNFMDGVMEISKILSDNDIELLGLNKSFKLPQELMTPERMTFLMEHNIAFQNKDGKR